MKTFYPQVEWTQSPNTPVRFTFGGNGHHLTCHRSIRYNDKWVGTLDHGAITSGGGEFGFEFETEEEVKAALIEAMQKKVDQKVTHALHILSKYTDLDAAAQLMREADE